uniref:DNA-directed DNA polymerase n=1 Tax=Parastrongyloides trichosuri TaxID=131310 RepID=A0A0N4ZJE5_PARTI
PDRRRPHGHRHDRDPASGLPDQARQGDRPGRRPQRHRRRQPDHFRATRPRRGRGPGQRRPARSGLRHRGRRRRRRRRGRRQRPLAPPHRGADRGRRPALRPWAVRCGPPSRLSPDPVSGLSLAHPVSAPDLARPWPDLGPSGGGERPGVRGRPARRPGGRGRASRQGLRCAGPAAHRADRGGTGPHERLGRPRLDRRRRHPPTDQARLAHLLAQSGRFRRTDDPELVPACGRRARRHPVAPARASAAAEPDELRLFRRRLPARPDRDSGGRGAGPQPSPARHRPLLRLQRRDVRARRPRPGAGPAGARGRRAAGRPFRPGGPGRGRQRPSSRRNRRPRRPGRRPSCADGQRRPAVGRGPEVGLFPSLRGRGDRPRRRPVGRARAAGPDRDRRRRTRPDVQWAEGADQRRPVHRSGRLGDHGRAGRRPDRRHRRRRDRRWRGRAGSRRPRPARLRQGGPVRPAGRADPESDALRAPRRPGLPGRRAGDLPGAGERPAGPARGRQRGRLGLPAAVAGRGGRTGPADAGGGAEPVERLPHRRRFAGRGARPAVAPARRGGRLLHRRAGRGRRGALHRPLHGLCPGRRPVHALADGPGGLPDAGAGPGPALCADQPQSAPAGPPAQAGPVDGNAQARAGFPDVCHRAVAGLGLWPPDRRRAGPAVRRGPDAGAGAVALWSGAGCAGQGAGGRRRRSAGRDRGAGPGRAGGQGPRRFL